MPTISIAGGATYNPLLVIDYSAERATGTTVQQRASHNQPSPDVTLRTASLRSGSLTLLFPSAASAQAAFDGLGAAVKPFTFTHEGRPQWTMYAVLGEGNLGLVIQDGAEMFIVRVPFQEVSA